MASSAPAASRSTKNRSRNCNDTQAVGSRSCASVTPRLANNAETRCGPSFSVASSRNGRKKKAWISGRKMSSLFKWGSPEGSPYPPRSLRVAKPRSGRGASIPRPPDTHDGGHAEGARVVDPTADGARGPLLIGGRQEIGVDRTGDRRQ